MRPFIAAVFAASVAMPAWALEAGQCATPQEADILANATGDQIIATRPLMKAGQPVGVRVLVQRKDGTFKEVAMIYGTDQVCHVQDFIGDPRKAGASL